VFPVVDSFQEYQDQVPDELHTINGHEWDPSRLVPDILRAFRLTRAQRQAFVSYKRNESSSVAVRLFDALSHRGYRVFLDTASVETGEDFQEALWGRMADVDLLLFLDTDGALSSKWVCEELARAHDLGLGVLQLVWPDQSRTSGTELSDCIELDYTDFVNEIVDSSGTLTDAALRTVLAEAERSRIRSLRARCDRVVADFLDQATERQLGAVVQTSGTIELHRDGSKVGTAIPLVGIPEAFTIQQHEELIAPSDVANSIIVYDGLGMRPAWAAHLEWLNRHHHLQTSQVVEIDRWLGGL
jgi:hypothetical protein